MIPEQFIFLGIAFNLTSYVLYILSIVKGYAKPNLVSWAVWTIAPFIAVFFQLKAGAGLSVLPVFMAGFGPLMIIVAAFLVKKAFWKLTAFDIFCGALALFSLVIYIFTHNLGISIFFAILADAIAFIPTMIKGWKFPETESHYAYSFSIISNTIALFVITNWEFTIYSFSFYLIIANVIMTFILFRNSIFKQFKS